jgi:hypothetical protein
MRFSVTLAALAIAGCASHASKEPAVERQVPVDASNIVEVQKAGYKIVNRDGQKLYCKRDLNTGSHVRYTTSCLTEQEMTALIQASRRSVDAMRRDIPPRQERARPFPSN